MTPNQVQLRRRKQEIRHQAEANRREQVGKDRASELICDVFAGQVEYDRAATVMLYVSFGSEVCTRRFLRAALDGEKRIVVPYCQGDTLGLFHLESLEELAESTFGILEPKRALRNAEEKKVDVRELDLMMVPGVAFDRHGGRLGHGKGYYDKLLAGVRADTLLAGVGFECQIFPEIPMLAEDVYMDRVITEQAIYHGRSRREGT